MEYVVACIFWIIVVIIILAVFKVRMMNREYNNLMDNHRQLRDEVSKLDNKIFEMRIDSIFKHKDVKFDSCINRGQRVIALCDEIIAKIDKWRDSDEC